MTVKDQSNILLLLKIPPPITGATLMNVRVCESTLLNDKFNLRKMLLSYSTSNKNFGKINFRKIFVFFSTLSQLISELTFKRIDLIYFQVSPTGIAFLRDSFLILLMKLYSKNVLLHLRAKGIHEAQNKNSFLRWYYRIVFKSTSIICLSDLLTFDVKEVYDNKPYIVHNGMTVYDFNFNKIDHKNVTILFLSNIMREKGVIEYVNALNELNKKEIPFQAKIIGQESDITATELNNYISELGLTERVTYEGPKYKNEKLAAYCDADIFVFPTYYRGETWGGVLLEAMQFGLPIITTSEGSIPIIIEDGISGYIVEKRNHNAISDKLERLIFDKELRLNLGNNAKSRFFENFTFEIFESRMEEVFNQVLRSR